MSAIGALGRSRRSGECPLCTAASEYLLFLKFRDRLCATGFRDGKGDLIAGMQRVQRQAALCFELFGCAADIRSDGTALGLLNRDGAIDPVNFGNRSGERLLGQSRRADDGEGRGTSQHDLCDFHGSLPVREYAR